VWWCAREVVVTVGTDDDAAALGRDRPDTLESEAPAAAVFVGDVTTPKARPALQELFSSSSTTDPTPRPHEVGT